MLTRQQVFASILGLVETNDWAVFDDIARAHPADYPPADRAQHNRIAALVERLLSAYDFTRSPAFGESVSGKTAAFAEMKARFESAPEKRQEHERRFREALARLVADDTVFHLLDRAEHPLLTELRERINALPAGG